MSGGPPREPAPPAESVPTADPPLDSSSRAIVTRGGWLFDADDFKAPLTPPAEQVEELALKIEAATAALAAIGVYYLPVVVGPKSLACTGTVAARLAAGHLWVGALRERLRDSDCAELFSLAPAMRDAVRRVGCYHRTDADWNDVGAFFAARAVAKELAKRIPGLRPPAPSELHLLPVPDYLGTLAGATLHELIEDVPVPVDEEVEPEAGVALDRRAMRALRMPLDGHLVAAEDPQARLAEDSHTRLAEDLHARLAEDSHTRLAEDLHPRLYLQAPDVRRPGSEGIRLAVVGDGVALGPLTWLAECAERTTFWRSVTPPLEQMELELPDAVVHMIRMRALPGLLDADYGSAR
jgi:hypothetical protein